MEGSFSIWTLEDYGREKGSGQWEIGFFFAPSRIVRKLRRNFDLTLIVGHL